MYDIVGYLVMQLLHTLIIFIFPPSLLPSGLDYHFYRGEIYATTTNRNLSRMRVNLMSSGEDLQLEVLSGTREGRHTLRYTGR